MTKYREILRLHSQGISQRTIAISLSCSRNTVSKVLKRAEELNVSWPFKKPFTDGELQELLFPKIKMPSKRKRPDCEYIHKEMAKSGVTLSLLWYEYCEACRLSNEAPLMYSQFCRYYQQYVKKTKATMHVIRKPGELLCYTYHHLYDIDIACLRIFTVYGPRQRPDLAIHKFIKLFLQNKSIPFYGNGNTERDYTYIDDVVDGIVKTIIWIKKNKNKYEIFNLGSSRTISLTEIIKTIEEALNKKASLKKLPMQPGDVNRTYTDIKKVKKILNYDPKIVFKEGIKKFIEWIKINNSM